MKDDLGLNTKKAIQELLLSLEHEHPEVLKNGGDIRSEEHKDFLITISKQKAVFESYQEKDFSKSLSISALGVGTPCPKCGGRGKI